MNSVTGEVFPTRELAITDAIARGLGADTVVELRGSQGAVQRVSSAVVAQRRAANKRARKARKANRRP